MLKSIDQTRIILVALLAVSAFLNYLDRQALAILASPIQADLNITNQGYAFIVSSFLVAYSAGNLICAWCIEKWGVRIALPVFVLWWSTANFLTGFATDTNTVAATRFALGLAETGGFIAITVMAQSSFKPSQRALVIGCCNAAAMIGATVSPPIIAWLYEIYGWRMAFYSTGLLGAVWTLCWVLMFVRNADKSDLSYDEKIDEQNSSTDQSRDDSPVSYLSVIKNRKAWAIVFGKMLTYPIWFFYLFWFPKYLTDERGLSVSELGQTVWVTYLAAAVGSIIGGMASGLLIKRGMVPQVARLWILAFVAVVGTIGIINGFEPPIIISIAVASFVAFVQMFWQINIQVLSTDIFGKRELVKVISMGAIITSIASVISNTLVGSLVETISYRPMFIVMGFAYAFAFLIVYLLLRESKSKDSSAD